MSYSNSKRAKKEAVATSFPQFGRLPVELQLMIWEEAFYLSPLTQQVIEGYVQEDNQVSYAVQKVLAAAQGLIAATGSGKFGESAMLPDRQQPHLMVFPAATRQCPPPALASVCHNSRRVVLKLGRGFTSLIVKGGQGTARPIWFDFSSDIVYFPTLSAEIYDSEGWVSPYNWEYRRRIKHLAIEWSYFHWKSYEDMYESYQGHWINAVHDLYGAFPALTDLYIFVPAVRLGPVPRNSMKDASDEEELEYHFEEPVECDGLPIILKHLPLEQRVRLARCRCWARPRDWDETMIDIDIALRSQWMKESIQEEFGNEVLKNFPPRVHERIFLRRGLDVDALRRQKPSSGLKVVIDRTLLGKKKDRM